MTASKPQASIPSSKGKPVTGSPLVCALMQRAGILTESQQRQQTVDIYKKRHGFDYDNFESNPNKIKATP